MHRLQANPITCEPDRNRRFGIRKDATSHCVGLPPLGNLLVVEA